MHAGRLRDKQHKLEVLCRWQNMTALEVQNEAFNLKIARAERGNGQSSREGMMVSISLLVCSIIMLHFGASNEALACSAVALGKSPNPGTTISPNEPPHSKSAAWWRVSEPATISGFLFKAETETHQVHLPYRVNFCLVPRFITSNKYILESLRKVTIGAFYLGFSTCCQKNSLMAVIDWLWEVSSAKEGAPDLSKAWLHQSFTNFETMEPFV